MSRGGPGARPGLGLGLLALTPELRLTGLLFALSFFISGMPRVFTQTAAHTLFIEAYGAQAMPWAYLAEALCVPLAGLLFMRAQRAASLRSLLVGTLALQIVALLGFRVGIAAGLPLVAGASIVYFEIEFVLSSLLLWGLASQLMTLRQGKRLFGFISAGEPVAVIVCGLSTPLLLRWLSVVDLFLLSAGGAAVGIALVLYILARQRPLAETEGEVEAGTPEATPAARPWWRDRYVATMVLLVAVGQLAYFFVDTAFYIEAGRRYPGEQEMAEFLGLYSAAMGGISLVCSVLLAPWLLRRFGVRAGLLALPGLLLLGALATVLTGVIGGPANLLFLLVVGNKVIDQSFRYTLDKTTLVTLFQPLPADQRSRVQAGLESIVEPLSGGVAGLLLFAMLHALGFGALGITCVIGVVAGLWVALVALQYRGYLGALRTALARRGSGGRQLTLDDPASRALLRQGLVSTRPGEALYCFSVLDELGLPLQPAEWAHLLQHPAREVRLVAAQRAGHVVLPRPPAEVAALLAQAAAAEADGAVRGALLEALAAVDEERVTELANHLDDPDPEVCIGAFAGLLRHGGVHGALIAGPPLLQALQAGDPARRRFAALVMGRACSDHFYRPLRTLLHDPEPAVALAALRAASGLRVPQLWPDLLAALAQPTLARAAARALAAQGDAVLPALQSWHDTHRDPRDPAATPPALLAVYERLATPAAAAHLLALLLAQAATASAPQRRRLMRGLRACACQPVGASPPALRALLVVEVDAATHALTAWRHAEALGGTGAGAPSGAITLLQVVAADEVTLSIESVFDLLALLYPGVDMRGALANYSRGGPVRRAYVAEMLDNLLDTATKRRLLPLLEAENCERRASRLLPALHPPAGPAWAALAGWAGDARGPGLLRACALFAAHAAGAPATALAQGLPAAVAWPGPGERVHHETLAWLRAGAPSPKERKTMLTIEKMLVLKSVPLFAAVRQEALAEAAASAQEVELATGATLFEQGEVGSSLYVIASGRLRAEVDGRAVAEMGEREVVGEMAVLDAEPRSASVVALQDCLLLRLTSDNLDQLMSEDVAVARGIIEILCRRLRLRDAAQR